MNRQARFFIGIVWGLSMASSPALGEAPPPCDASKSNAATSDNGPGAGEVRPLPGVMIDREKGYVELDARVVLREGKWLELLACTPGSKEHESILTVTARPSHIHLALLILGIEPGSPMQWHWQGDQFHVTPPLGPKLAITLHYTNDKDQAVQVPANQWVRDQKDDKLLEGNHWLFTGSRSETIDDKVVYRADINGSAISIVNFGDDLLARPTTMTHQDDHATWAANTAAIPPVGTKVVIRLTVVKE